MSKSVIIVDDHVLFTQSLKTLVNFLPEFTAMETYKNGSELIEHFENDKPKPDIILLDLRMPVMNGIETMTWLQENYPGQAVLALTMEDEEQSIIKMLNLGCRGYLLKDIEPEEFAFAMNCVLKNGYYISEEISEVWYKKPKPKAFDNITRREREFLQLASTEMTYKEMAEKMDLSPKTIDGYRESLFGKLEVKSRVGLVVFAIKHGLCEI